MTTDWKDDWSEQALAEYAEAALEYLQIDPKLADDLESRVDRAIELLLNTPESAAPYLEETRRKLLTRFPYALVYRLDYESKILRVIAFSHQSREPGYWSDR